jgi:hypothetical protein
MRVVFHDLLLIVVESIQRHTDPGRMLSEQQMDINCGVPHSIDMLLINTQKGYKCNIGNRNSSDCGATLS